MTDQSNYAIPRLSDWLKNPTPPCLCLFFPRFEEVTGYDQFVALFALVLIDRWNDSSIGFLTVI